MKSNLLQNKRLISLFNQLIPINIVTFTSIIFQIDKFIC